MRHSENVPYCRLGQSGTGKFPQGLGARFLTGTRGLTQLRIRFHESCHRLRHISTVYDVAPGKKELIDRYPVGSAP